MSILFMPLNTYNEVYFMAIIIDEKYKNTEAQDLSNTPDPVTGKTGSLFESASSAVTGAVNGVVGSIANAASEARAKAAGLLEEATGIDLLGGSGGSNPVVQWLGGDSNTAQAAQAGSSQESATNAADWRLKITVNPEVKFMQADLLKPLRSTSGFIFPFLPQSIQITHNARYTAQQLTHNNYTSYSYDGSDVAEININADFVIQEILDGQYLLAGLQFFRSCTKMYFGNDSAAGVPPPMVFLDGFGTYYFPHVPCVIKSFTHTMTADVDYVNVPAPNGGGWTRLPTQSQLQIVLIPVYSRTRMKDFSLTSFASGDYAGSSERSGSGQAGGFI